MGGVDAIAGEEVHDDGATVSETGLAEQFGRAERQQTADSGREGAQRAGLGRQLRAGIRVGRCPHDDASSVVEFGHGGVVATGRAFGENADSDHSHPGQSRRHGRG